MMEAIGLVGISLVDRFNLPVAAINLFYGVVSAWGLLKICTERILTNTQKGQA